MMIEYDIPENDAFRNPEETENLVDPEQIKASENPDEMKAFGLPEETEDSDSLDETADSDTVEEPAASFDACEETKASSDAAEEFDTPEDTAVSSLDTPEETGAFLAPEDNAPSPMEGIQSNGKRPKRPYPERAYLLYGKAADISGMDLKGAKDFLNSLGFDGGEMRQARVGKHFSEKMNELTQAENQNPLCCSYCGQEITGVDYSSLPDGRLRRNVCDRTLVRSREELSEIYVRILDHLEAFFGAVIMVPIDIEMLEERKLKKKIKRPLSEVDDKSILILGAAVRKGKKNYSLYLENGLPRLSAIATFIHELTHIWQYINWDDTKSMPKISPMARLLIYEGMAKWVEIQYLYLIGEVAAAKREEEFTLLREDAYGKGFRLYADRYPISREAMYCEANPFKTDSYPIL